MSLVYIGTKTEIFYLFSYDQNNLISLIRTLFLHKSKCRSLFYRCYIVDDWDFDQDSPSTGDNFKDVLDEWLRSHAQNSVYDMSNNTDKYIHMTVNIPLWNVERGRSYTLSNFSSDLKKFLKTQLGDGYKASVTAQGQKLEIMIQ